MTTLKRPPRSEVWESHLLVYPAPLEAHQRDPIRVGEPLAVAHVSAADLG
jgi:hypothetical protein